jgi:hypothetical protein
MINSTKIRARHTSAEAAPYEAVIDALAILTEGGVQYETPVWTGVKELWCTATAKLAKSATKVVALEIDSHKYRVDLDHRFLIVRTKATRDREQEIYPANELLAWIQASNMRIGDRLYFPAYDNIRKDWTKQDKHTGLGFIAVNKLRVQDLDEPVEIYSLSVSRYHHFIMPSGIISGA